MSPSPRFPKPSPGKSAAKPPSKPAPRPRAGAGTKPAASFETAFAALGRKADDARTRLSGMTDEGAKVATRELQKATRAAQTKVRKLNADWKNLPPKRRAQVVAGVLGAIAAAIAVPFAVRKLRRSRAGKPAGTAEE